MKNLFFFFIMAVVFFACKSKEKDVVNDYPAVHQWDPHDLATIDKIKSIPDKEKFNFIKKELPNLIPTIIGRVKSYDPKAQIDSIYFNFVEGKGKAKGVEDATGASNDGPFEGQLVAFVLTKEKTKFGNPVKIFVRCLNGVLEIDGELKFVGGISSSFTILPGQGLAHHLPQLAAWGNAADEVGVPIKNENGKVVSKKVYANYLGQYESVLYPYDVINMDSKTAYDKQGKEINFEKRLTETRKANISILQKRIAELQKLQPKGKIARDARAKKLLELKREYNSLKKKK